MLTIEDLCQDVAIIDAGRVVLTGAVADLQQESPDRIVEIEVRDADALTPLLHRDGVIESAVNGRQHRLRVTRDLRVEHLLDDLPADVEIRHLAYTTLALTDLFTQAVA